MTAMRFRNYGGIYQFRIRTEEDLARIDDLDPARWAATSAPLADLNTEPAFARVIDPENTGRVRHSQVVAARDWLFERLADKRVVRGKRVAIPIEAIVAGGPGEALRGAARRVNRERSAKNAGEIAVDDVRAYKADYHKILENGDGVVPEGPLPEGSLKAFVHDVLEVIPGERDRGGDPGVSAAMLDRFETQGRAWLAWSARESDVLVWGAQTEEARVLVEELGPKIDEYFTQCELLRQEEPSKEALKLKEDELRALRARAATDIANHLAQQPLTTLRPDGVLVLDAVINAVFRERFEALVRVVLSKTLGEGAKTLDRAGWAKTKAALEPYTRWRGEKPAEPFEKLGREKLEGYLDAPVRAEARAQIEKDLSAAGEIAAIDDLEKVLLFVRWIVELTNNFVNFSALYGARNESLVDVGSLVIDGRRLEFCMKVADRAAHKTVASESLCFLVYAKITDKVGDGESFEVVAPVTSGERGRLRVGKRGIFIDLHAKEWDAQVIEIVENPISVREAAFAPFRRAGRFLGDKVDEWINGMQRSQEQALMERTAAVAPGATPAAEGAAAPAAAPAAGSNARQPEGLNINTLILGGGVALAGLGAVMASLFAALTKLSGWIAILGVVAGVMTISAVAGWLKLRKRDMSLILEASGWAVNIHMRVTRHVAGIFAFTPALPKDAQIDTENLVVSRPNEEPGEGDDVSFAGQLLLLAVMLAALAAIGYWQFRRVH